MKIYTNTFDVAFPAPHRFWVAPYSDFAIGVKIVKGGEPLASNFTVKQGSTELEPQDDKIDGFTIFTVQSGATGSVEYTIEIDGLIQKQKLYQIVTDSTVFDVGTGGGGVPADVATKGWVRSQISGFVDESELTAYATKEYVTQETSAFITENALSGYKTYAETKSSLSNDGYATKAEATLKERTGFSGWTILRAGVDVTEQIAQDKMPRFEEGPDNWYVADCHIPSDGELSFTAEGALDALQLQWYAGSPEQPSAYSATRTALAGYQLGSQSDKPLQPAGDYATVDSLSAKVTAAKDGNAPLPTTMKSIYETAWATLSANADANTVYVVLPDPF